MEKISPDRALLGAADIHWIPGPVGDLETIYLAARQPHGVAVLCHPNPLQGGTFTHKIIQTAAKFLSGEGFECYLPNLRGVGQSAGAHDYGRGEVEDVQAVLAYARAQHPALATAVLGGFSFGGYVAIKTAVREPVDALLLMGPAVANYAEPAPPVPNPARTLIIQGDRDDVTPPANLSAWAEKQNLPYVSVPGAEHFFHGKIMVLLDVLKRYWPTLGV